MQQAQAVQDNALWPPCHRVSPHLAQKNHAGWHRTLHSHQGRCEPRSNTRDQGHTASLTSKLPHEHLLIRSSGDLL